MRRTTNLDIPVFRKTEAEFVHLLDQLSAAEEALQGKVQQHWDGNVLRGADPVAWLGLVYAKCLLNGRLLVRDQRRFIQTEEGGKVYVKTRKGQSSGWNQTGTMSDLLADDHPTHLLFIHLHDNYQVSSMWLYPWEYLQNSDRLISVRGGGFRMMVDEGRDRNYRVYTNPHQRKLFSQSA